MSEREQMYLAAASKMHKTAELTSDDARWQRYLAAMEIKYPDDINASLFYALALVYTAGSGQAGIERRRTALDILLRIFASHPDNPGAGRSVDPILSGRTA